MSWEEVGAEVLAHLREGRDEQAWAAIDEAATTLETRWPPPIAGFREAGRDLYWTHRAVPEYVRLQQEQIRRIGDGDPVRLAGALYDLASFTWPGWGIAVGPEERAVGAAAADLCLRLRQAGEGEGEFTITEGMAHWVAGAHALAAGDRAVDIAGPDECSAEDERIMHPLPRGPEIDPVVDQDPRAMYWRQERNGMWMRVAVLIKIFAAEDRVLETEPR